jgi:hypothetical protein
MCSNCSGDDLSPESFATFDVSSPTSREHFAGGLRKKRKPYRTIAILKELIKGALTLGEMHIRRGRRRWTIIRRVHLPSFVNLNLGTLSDEDMANTLKITRAAGLIEVRVSADSIVEVYSGARPIQNGRNEYGLSERQLFSSWDESYAERSDLRRAMASFRRVRRLKHVAAYAAFIAFAAIAVWCAVR